MGATPQKYISYLLVAAPQKPIAGLDFKWLSLRTHLMNFNFKIVIVYAEIFAVRNFR